MVAAAVAWVRAARPDLTADQVGPGRAALGASTTTAGLASRDTGFGVLYVAAALQPRRAAARPAEPNDDIVLGRRARLRQAATG